MLQASWPGKNGFWCDKRYLKGADWHKTIITGLFTITSGAFAIAFPGKGLYDSEVCVPVILMSVLLIATLGFLFVATTTDPGYIPKQVFPFANKNILALNEHLFRPKPFTYTYKNTVIKLKFCQTCLIYRPPRCSHCSVCNLCVEGFDHHCPWIGNCIGKRNYFHFFAFITSALGLCVVVFISSVYYLVLNSKRYDYDTIISIIIAIFAIMIMVIVIILFTFHVYLIYAGSNTNEKIKNVWYDHMNPFNQGGFIKNFVFKFQEFFSKSQYNIRARVLSYEEDLDINSTHRGTVVYKSFAYLSRTFDEKFKGGAVVKLAGMSKY